MGNPKKKVWFLLVFTAIIMLLFLIMQPLEVFHFHHSIDVLFPKGWVGLEERNLLFIIQGLMLLVIVPVYALTFLFSWWYRADNKKATYDPDLVDHSIAEYIWWGLPLVMTLIIAAITWVKTYELDPFKPIIGHHPEKKIQVVALQWRWLFIYPEEKIATLNYLQLPKDTPIHFEITADAPMNSFWIPQLGGQIYAMPNMKTELHLIANETGIFRGCSANISGEGFAGMHFVVHASSQEEYADWVRLAQQSEPVLGVAEYNLLAAPSFNNRAAMYRLGDEGLFNHVLMKYMHE